MPICTYQKHIVTETDEAYGRHIKLV